MTPRHLSMLCLGQLASIGAGMMLCRLARKFLQAGFPRPMPTEMRLLADYGWWLILVPILCVLFIPRYREDADPPPAAQRLFMVLLGFATVGYPLVTGMTALLKSLTV